MLPVSGIEANRRALCPGERDTERGVNVVDLTSRLTASPVQESASLTPRDKGRRATRSSSPSAAYVGIHWQYDNQAGLTSGRALADYVFFNFLTPIVAADADNERRTQDQIER